MNITNGYNKPLRLLKKGDKIRIVRILDLDEDMARHSSYLIGAHMVISAEPCPMYKNDICESDSNPCPNKGFGVEIAGRYADVGCCYFIIADEKGRPFLMDDL